MDTVLKQQLPTMLTICETTELTGLTDYSIRRLIKESKIVYIKVGSKYLVNFESLVAYLNLGER